MNSYTSSPSVYRSVGQTLQNNNGRWFVEDDRTRQVRYVGQGDFGQSYDDCVSWLQWFTDMRNEQIERMQGA